MFLPLYHSPLWLLGPTSVEKGCRFHCMRKDHELILMMEDLVAMSRFSLKRTFRSDLNGNPLLIASQNSIYFSVSLCHSQGNKKRRELPWDFSPDCDLQWQTAGQLPTHTLGWDWEGFQVTKLPSYMASIWQTHKHFLISAYILLKLGLCSLLVHSYSWTLTGIVY